MNDLNQDSFRQEHLEYLLLNEVEKNPQISQRSLSRKIGTSLAVTNALMKRVIGKGWVRIQGLKPRNIAYLITPRGFREKGKVTYRFLKRTFILYREAKAIFERELAVLKEKGCKTLFVVGSGDELEVFNIVSQNLDLQVSAILDMSKEENGSFFHVPVFPRKGIFYLRLLQVLFPIAGLDKQIINSLFEQKTLFNQKEKRGYINDNGKSWDSLLSDQLEQWAQTFNMQRSSREESYAKAVLKFDQNEFERLTGYYFASDAIVILDSRFFHSLNELSLNKELEDLIHNSEKNLFRQTKRNDFYSNADLTIKEQSRPLESDNKDLIQERDEKNRAENYGSNHFYNKVNIGSNSFEDFRIKKDDNQNLNDEPQITREDELLTIKNVYEILVRSF